MITKFCRLYRLHFHFVHFFLPMVFAALESSAKKLASHNFTKNEDDIKWATKLHIKKEGKREKRAREEDRN